MSTKKATKRALLTSILAICLCLVMLVGSTFAWFTDTASTGVNKIQSGTLDVVLEMYDTAQSKWVSAEGKTLDFVKAVAGEEILWEPGCRYELPALRVRNNGNLALKYKIAITGIKGDAELNNVIDWTVTTGTGTYDLNTEHYLAAKTSNDAPADEFVIKGVMQESAGNTYMNKTIDGISITVYATQNTVENDSYGPDYDADAVYPVLAPVINETVAEAVAAEESVTVIKEGATEASTATLKTTGTLEKTIKTTASTPDSVTFDISYNYTETENGTSTTYAVTKFSTPRTTTKTISAGLKNVAVTRSHGTETTALTKVDSKDALIDGTFFYDAATGELAICSSKYSTFKITYESDFVAAVNGQGYNTLLDAVAAANNGGTVVLCKSEALALNNTEPMTISNVTFKSASGVVINGMKLIATRTKNMVTLENVKFEGITFTDRVVLGQDIVSYGLSKCSNITFNNCKFDLTNSQVAAASRYAIKCSTNSNTDDNFAYANGLTVTNCEFTNVARGIYFYMARNATVKNCTFTNCSSFAVHFVNFVGQLDMVGNAINQAKSVLNIGTIANNFATADIKSDVTIKDNAATGLTCDNGEAFMATYDNARASGKSTYTITGNTVEYSENYDEPLCGFRIKTTYGPSVAEFIENK